MTGASDNPASRRLVFACDLRDEAAAIEVYKEWHQPGRVPAGVVDSIRDSGALRVEIFQCGNRLMMVMDVPLDFDGAATTAKNRSNQVVQDWERLMWQYQQALPFANPGQKWVPMTRIFSLAEHLTATNT